MLSGPGVASEVGKFQKSLRQRKTQGLLGDGICISLAMPSMFLFNLVIPGISYKNSSLWLGDLLLRLLRENRRRLTDLQNCPRFRRCCLMPAAVHPRTNMSF